MDSIHFNITTITINIKYIFQLIYCFNLKCILKNQIY
jgi:hypothetical protein